MSGERYEVRAAPSFFEDLERQLRSERGPNGEPSTADFQTFELLNIVERFRTGFDDLPELLPGRSDYRVLIATGALIRAYTVVGQRRPDGAVELLTLELDLGMEWD